MKQFKESRNFLLFPARTVLGWRVIRRVSFREGETRVGVGEWRRVLDGTTHEHIGYQICTPEMSRGDYELPTIFSPASISVREMQVNAGLFGRSRTEGLSEDRRLARRNPEDRVERAHAKVVEFGKRRLVQSPVIAAAPEAAGWDAFQDMARVAD